MTTGYMFTDTWPKDVSGQKGVALVDAQTSQLDFTMLKGICTSPIGSPAKRLGHLGVGTHGQGSAIETGHPLVALGGVYIESVAASPATCATTPGLAQMAVVSNWGEIGARSLPVTPSQLSTSANLVKNGSGIVYSMMVAVSQVQPGAVFRLRSSTSDLLTIIAGSAFGIYTAQIPDGGLYFQDTIEHAQTVNGGAASVNISFR